MVVTVGAIMPKLTTEQKDMLRRAFHPEKYKNDSTNGDDQVGGTHPVKEENGIKKMFKSFTDKCNVL